MIDRPPLLAVPPEDEVGSLQELIGIANAIEVEAVARYTQLAALMERRGDHDTAAIFRDMCEIEKGHVDAVARWATALKQELPPARDFTWRLPPEIAASWDEAQDSSLLTPYRALAIAVVNEERAFAFYSYIAAQATRSEVARQAEAMAREELAHAAEMRVHRRKAYRRAYPEKVAPPEPGIESLASLHALEHRLDGETAALHDKIARALEAAGDVDSAALVIGLTAPERRPTGGGETASAQRSLGVKPEPRDAAALLRAALQPLERASEVYEDLIAHAAREDLLLAEQAALQRVVERISMLAKRLHELENAS